MSEKCQNCVKRRQLRSTARNYFRPAKYVCPAGIDFFSWNVSMSEQRRSFKRSSSNRLSRKWNQIYYLLASKPPRGCACRVAKPMMTSLSLRGGVQEKAITFGSLYLLGEYELRIEQQTPMNAHPPNIGKNSPAGGV